MEFKEFCTKIYDSCHDISNQVIFIKKMFTAAGFSSYYSDAHLKSVFNGAKPFSDKMKSEFPRSIDEVQLATFFIKYLDPNKLLHVMLEFGISEDIGISVALFSKALARQLIKYIRSDNQDVASVVSSEYNQLFADPSSAPITAIPYFHNDDAYVRFLPERTYNKKCYENFEHRWQILNNGKCKWQDRKLVFVNLLSEGPKVNTTSIGIPDTEPGKETTLAVQYDAGGFERRFECRWDMQDSSGNNCFPNDVRKFLVTINVDLGD